MSKHRIRRAVFAVVGLALSLIARADLYSARQAYEKQDFPKAFELYRELAELGQVRAQEFLASMYVGGEGVKRDNILGYGWASIARDNGANDEAMNNIIDQLEPHMTDKARTRVAELKAQFGDAGLRKRILPDIFERANYIDREPCHLAKGPTKQTYPDYAVREGIQGDAYVEFTVMPDGRARNPRVIYALPGDTFDEAARDTVLNSEFTPAHIKGVPVTCTIGMMVRFELKGMNKADYPELTVFMKKTKEKAEAGDPSAQLLYGMAISGLPQFKQPRSEGMPWILKSAQAGMPTAQFMIGYSTLQGWGCQCDEPKALEWLYRAAAADQADAQVVLANYLLRGEPKSEDIDKALKWLERAAASGSRDGKVYLAALLAAGVDAEKRDPQRALTVLKEVMHDVDVDPTAFEIRAAAYASLGKFEDAQKDEARALKMAKKLGWETASQQSRMTAYQANKPWSGDLFAF